VKRANYDMQLHIGESILTTVVMDSGPASSAQNSFAILSRRRIPE